MYHAELLITKALKLSNIDGACGTIFAANMYEWSGRIKAVKERKRSNKALESVIKSLKT